MSFLFFWNVFPKKLRCLVPLRILHERATVRSHPQIGKAPRLFLFGLRCACGQCSLRLRAGPRDTLVGETALGRAEATT